MNTKDQNGGVPAPDSPAPLLRDGVSAEPRRPSWGLLRKTALFSAMVLLLALALFGYLVLPLLRSTLEKSLQSQGKALAASITQVVTTSILSEEYSSVVDHCLEVLKREPSIRFIVVARRDGFCLIHQPGVWNQETLGLNWSQPVPAVIRGNFEQNPFAREELYHQAFALSYSSIDWGWLHLGLSLDSYQADLKAIYQTLGMITLFSILVGLILSGFFSNLLVRPISQLQEFAGRVAGGDLAAGPAIHTGDEVESLAVAFNGMIDALRRSRGELIAARDYADNVIGSMNDCLVVLTPERVIRSVNAATCRVLECPKEALVGRPVDLVFPAEVGSGHSIDWKKLLDRVSIVNQEYEMTAGSGRRIPILFSASVMSDSSGGAVGFVTVAKDISALKQAEEEKRELELQIQQTQKLESLGVLAGGIAHDFNNLLMGILGNAELLRFELPEDSPAIAGLHEVETAALRAADLAKQLLAYAGKGRFLIQMVDLNELVREMAQLLETSISRKVSLELRFYPGLPLTKGDATQIRQVVMNLIINASDAIGDRRGMISLRTGIRKIENQIWDDNYFLERIADGMYVFVEVSDDGCGMSEVTMSRIFDPFFSTKFTGRGLGLAATLGIIRSHQGAISVKSTEGKGTTFRILLPVKEGVIGAAEQKSQAGIVRSSHPVEPLPEGQGGLVLLADDELAIRSLSEKMLRRLGCEPLSAVDGEEAVQLFRRRGPEIGLVILDMTMPRLNGEEAFKEIRKLDPHVPILVSSGYDENETMARFVGAEHVACLQKPFLYKDFSARIREMIRQCPKKPEA